MKGKHAINNLAYNEHTNAYFKCNKTLTLSDLYELQVSNYIFQLLHSNIDEEIQPSLLLIIKFTAIIQGPTTTWVFYAWIELKQNIVAFTVLW